MRKPPGKAPSQGLAEVKGRVQDKPKQSVQLRFTEICSWNLQHFTSASRELLGSAYLSRNSLLKKQPPSPCQEILYLEGSSIPLIRSYRNNLWEITYSHKQPYTPYPGSLWAVQEENKASCCHKQACTLTAPQPGARRGKSIN